MTFETFLNEKEKEIKVLKDQIDNILSDVYQEAIKAYDEDGLEAFVDTAPSGIDDVKYMGVASIVLDPNGDTGHYLFIPQLDTRHNGWVPSSWMD